MSHKKVFFSLFFLLAIFIFCCFQINTRIRLSEGMHSHTTWADMRSKNLAMAQQTI